MKRRKKRTEDGRQRPSFNSHRDLASQRGRSYCGSFANGVQRRPKENVRL